MDVLSFFTGFLQWELWTFLGRGLRKFRNLRRNTGDVTRSSPVKFSVYLKYCIQDGNLVPRFSHLPVYYACFFFAIFPEESWGLEWIRIRQWDTCGRANSIWIRISVEVEIFESKKKKFRIFKYPDTCGRGLIAQSERPWTRSLLHPRNFNCSQRV